MTGILRNLAEGGFREFNELFEPWRGVSVLVITFLALLELVRERLVEVTQAEPYTPIYVKLAQHAESE
jgi:segregation and condensation protein A